MDPRDSAPHFGTLKLDEIRQSHVNAFVTTQLER